MGGCAEGSGNEQEEGKRNSVGSRRRKKAPKIGLKKADHRKKSAQAMQKE